MYFHNLFRTFFRIQLSQLLFELRRSVMLQTKTIILYMEETQRFRKREKKKEKNFKTSKQAALACWSLFFFYFFYFSKKMITKKLLWVRLCSFQPTDIYARVCVHVCLHVRTSGKKIQTKLRVFFVRLRVATSVHTSLKNADQAGCIYVPRQEWFGYINFYDTDWKVFSEWFGTSLDLTERRGCHGGDICI